MTSYGGEEREKREREREKVVLVPASREYMLWVESGVKLPSSGILLNFVTVTQMHSAYGVRSALVIVFYRQTFMEDDGRKTWAAYPPIVSFM